MLRCSVSALLFGAAVLVGGCDRSTSGGRAEVSVPESKHGRRVLAGGKALAPANLEGWFKAVDATPASCTGSSSGSGIISQPTIFKWPDGRRYVAIISGIGGWIGSMISHDLDPRDPTAAKGWGNMLANLKKVTNKGAGTLFVFALSR